MIHRILTTSNKSSFFLFGARGTGKTTYLKSQFEHESVRYIDLLNPELEDHYSKRPMALEHEYLQESNRPDWIVIDEIQKLPKLLNVVHRMIESYPVHFVLTGSSARKLRREASNLLAGRAFTYSLFPFSYLELKNNFNLIEHLHWGGLPHLQSFEDPKDKIQFLRSYIFTYISQEIVAEQIVRKLDPFRLFLPVLGQVAGKIINHKKLASEIGVDTKTVQSYFEIIEETLLGHYLPAFHLSIRKGQRVAPKFYLFDTGIKKALEGSLEQIPLPRTTVYGELFEMFIIEEVFKLNEYKSRDYQLSYYQSKDGGEIDLILSKNREHTLVEIKSSDNIDLVEVRSLAKLAEDFPNKKDVYYVSNCESEQLIENVHCIHWTTFLEKIV